MIRQAKQQEGAADRLPNFQCKMFRQIKNNKKQYLDLLLIADEQEDMIDRYLERGDMWVLDDRGVKAVCVVTDEVSGTLEIKNLAVVPHHQRQGYGKAMIAFVIEHYRDYCKIIVGTGDSPMTIPFYQSCGFKKVGLIKDFFTENYDHPIIEDGILLKDMVILERSIER